VTPGWLSWLGLDWASSSQRWPGRVLRRGEDSDGASWMVDVSPPSAPDALALALALGARGALATFFVPVDEPALAERLRAEGQAVGWLGPLPAGRSDLEGRLPYWRPLRSGGAAAHLAAGEAGLVAVAPTVVLPPLPSGLAPVATDLVLVPANLAGPRLAAWLEDHERRAIRLLALPAPQRAGPDGVG
jgi:hypothetical protein